MTTTLTLTPEAAHLAATLVESGRHASAEAAVTEALRLLRAREDTRARLATMVDEALADVAANGTVTLEDALAAMDEEIASAEVRQRATDAAP